MFEVDDLSQASPATVSRCGMIYFDPSSLPWTALADSWIRQLPERFQGLAAYLRGLMDQYIPSFIQFAEMDAQLALGSNPRFFLRNLLRILSCYQDVLRTPIMESATEAEEAKEIDPLDYSNYFTVFSKGKPGKIDYLVQDHQQKALFERIFIFCLIWSFGAVLAEDSRSVFDNLLKNTMERNNSNCIFPAQQTCFDYCLDLAQNGWVPWCDGPAHLDIDDPIEQQLVPTAESAAMVYFARLLTIHNRHLLFHGPETSKSLCVSYLMRSVLDGAVYDNRVLPVACCSTSAGILRGLRSFLHRRKGQYGPMPDHELVVFLDNLNSVRPEVYGAQPPLELIR
jgi:hypothetical protein